MTASIMGYGGSCKGSRERARSQEGEWNDIEALLQNRVRGNKSGSKVASVVL